MTDNVSRVQRGLQSPSNLLNVLTMARLVFVPVFNHFGPMQDLGHEVAAFVIFALAPTHGSSRRHLVVHGTRSPTSGASSVPSLTRL